jgi:rod shape-determining protein MreB
MAAPRDASTKANDKETGKEPAVAPKDKTHGVLYVGVDLGTSRTAVAASNGVRASVPSFVGYPKDHVSRKLLGREVLFGDDVIENRLALRWYRPLEKGVIKGSDGAVLAAEEVDANMRAAHDLLGHAISLVRPRPDEVVYGVVGAPAQASVKNQKALLDAGRELFDSVLICSEPFAVAYGLDWLDDVLVIDIGAGTVDLCRMHGTMPEENDQITLTTAGDWVDEQLEMQLRERCPGAQFTRTMVKALKEKYSTVLEDGPPIEVDFPVRGKPTRFDVTEAVRTACRGIVPPIVEALGELVASFDPEFQERLRNRVLLAGGGSQIGGLERAVEKEMRERLGGGRVLRIEEPVYGGANGALKIAHDMPPEYWKKVH